MPHLSESKKRKIAIVTSLYDSWGGSEELWALSIPYLLDKENFSITLYKNTINKNQPEFVNLANYNVAMVQLAKDDHKLKNSFLIAKDLVKKVGDKLGLYKYTKNQAVQKFYQEMKKSMPALAIIAQGVNFDGLVYAYQCLLLKIPYIVVCQKSVDFYWPEPQDRKFMKDAFINAEKILFVSEQNLKITEEQFGMRFKNAEVVFNPVRVAKELLPFPTTDKGFKLACIGRLFVIDKGQDILLRILQKEKWKKRDISISLIGSGPDEEGLIEMARLLELENVNFVGFKTNLREIWKEHHALIFPSRSEGLPLTVLEAMSFGRLAILSNAGGNNEVVCDGINAFIGEPNELQFDQAMERAWENRHNWEAMGIDAYYHIQSVIPVRPEELFAEIVIKALNTI
ncbi:glycosyltransferase [Pedobacter aquatilis]|uniref:glycosyltransferase n=1 Tax=Pedobacter aquatilis TaxID=351343 RepID=UPI00292E570B|nr:glycosyltransferase [Pedobacter aquatilis]